MSSKAESINMKYVGIPNVKTTYSGDGMYCNTDRPNSCEVSVVPNKAAQLLNDFPAEWEVSDGALGGKSVIKFIQENSYNNKMIGTAEARKGIKVIYPDGSEMTYPAGTEIKVNTPEHKPIMKETTDG